MNKKTRVENDNEGTETKEEVVKLSDVKDFSAGFWLISIICVAYYIAIFPLIALGK